MTNSKDSKEKKALKASDHDSYGFFLVIALIIPFLGGILGLIYLCKDKPLDRKLGATTLGASIAFFFFWIFLFTII